MRSEESFKLRKPGENTVDIPDTPFVYNKFHRKIKAPMPYPNSVFWYVVLFALGIVISYQFKISFIFAAVSLAVSFGFIIPAFSKPNKASGKQWRWLLPIAMALGVFWMSINSVMSLLPSDSDGKITVRGMVESSVNADADGAYTFVLIPESVDGKPFGTGEILIYAYDGQALGKGDIVEVDGYLLGDFTAGNPNAFNYGQYLLRQGIIACVTTANGGVIRIISNAADSVTGRLVSVVRNGLEQALSRLPDNTAHLVEGIVLGEKADLLHEQKQVLVQTGVFHAFSVSGMHVGYVVVLGCLLLLPLSRISSMRIIRLIRLIVIGVMLLFYGTLVGWQPPVVRATVMAVMILGAAVLFEEPNTYTAIAIAAFVCLTESPLIIFDAGFQISFLATLGIVYIQPLYRDFFGGGTVRTAIYVTIAASLSVMPLLARYFYILSFSGLLVSPMADTLIGMVVILGFVCSLLSPISASLTAVFIYACGALTDALYWLCAQAAAFPGSYMITGIPSLWAVLLYYAILLAMPYIYKHGGKTAAFLLPVALLLFLTMPFAAQPPAQSRLTGDLMEVTFIDVGQGDAALVITPGGYTVLVDGGGNLNAPGSVGEYILLPYLQSRGIYAIDLIINSHPDADHSDGLLTVMENMPVKKLMLSSAAENADNLAACALKNKVGIIYGTAGDTVRFPDGAAINILTPDSDMLPVGSEENDHTLSCMLTWGETDFLFTGDLGLKGLAVLSRNDIKAEVLKLPHHGSVNSYDEGFYAAAEPAVAVVGVGRRNPFGHPAPAIIDYFASKNIPLFRTDRDGAISVFTNGSQLEVITLK